jgi:apolipoprotein D and lipocalin family protein
MGNTPTKPATVTTFDPIKYQGDWWEIAKYPVRFQQECKRAKANYLWDNNKQEVIVTNTCFLEDGSTCDVIGTAKNTNSNFPGRFIVTFPGTPGAVPGQYWLHWTDYDRYAIVGNGNRSNLWILSREKCISSADYSLLAIAARGFGYNINRLKVSENAVGNCCDSVYSEVKTSSSSSETPRGCKLGCDKKAQKGFVKMKPCGDEESSGVISDDEDHKHNHYHRMVKSEPGDTVGGVDSSFWNSQ